MIDEQKDYALAVVKIERLSMMAEAICPYCNKPAGPAMEHAKVSHSMCLYNQLEETRKRVPSDYGRKNVQPSKKSKKRKG